MKANSGLGSRRQKWHWEADSDTHFPNKAFQSALKLYLEITASSLSILLSVALRSPSVYFCKISDIHHCCLPFHQLLLLLCLPIYPSTLCSTIRWGWRAVINPLPTYLTPRCKPTSDTLLCPYVFVFKKHHPSFQIWPQWISIQNAWLREGNVYLWKPFFYLLVCVCVCVAAAVASVLCDPLSMFSLVLSSTLVGVALPIASLTTVSIATVCSLLVICTKAKCPNVTYRL